MIFNPDEGLAIPTFVMDRQNVERVSTFENLRVLFSEKGDWDTHTPKHLQQNLCTPL
jgi:hypothetical protein